MKPKILVRLESQLRDRGMNKAESEKVAKEQLAKNGILHPGTEKLTYYGETRNNMSAAERAKDRAATYSKKHKPSDYTYNAKTNLATLKKGK
jgi:hypothetical protein